MKNSRFLTVLFILSILIAFFLGFFVGGIIRDSGGKEAPTEPPVQSSAEESPSDAPSETVSTEPEPTAAQPVETDEPVDEPVSDPSAENSDIDLSGLKASLDTRFADYVSDWVVLVEDLQSGEQITSGTNGLTASSPVTSASVIKLFIAGAVYDAAEKDGKEIDELTEISLKNMISVSDNESANNLIRQLGNGDGDSGFAAVNAFIESIGCTSTKLNRFFLGEGEENLVSAADCARVLDMIYNGTYVSQQASDDILEMLKNQERTRKIPSGLTDFSGVSSANKTGELDNTENDVAIVYTPKGNYILCILASKINNRDDALKTITEISKEVCAFYNPGE